MKKCIALFSSGLDSVVAVHLMKSQNIDVIGLHYVLPFEANLGNDFPEIKEMAKILDIPVIFYEEGQDFIDMVRNPKYGYGKGMNPCIDCRILRLKTAYQIMLENNADFIVTGEVVGQRPMSQRLETLLKISGDTGIEDILLRPLSAQLLPPTLPERENWVDRSKLLSIKGRGRNEQFEYAKKYNLKHGAPGGGCLLTAREFPKRYKDLEKFLQNYKQTDFQLLAYGRQFRLSPDFKLIVSRDENENLIIEKLIRPEDYSFDLSDIPGPLAVGIGNPTQVDLNRAAAFTARYSKARNLSNVNIKVMHSGQETILNCKPADSEECDRFKITGIK